MGCIERNVERNGKEVLQFSNTLADYKSKLTDIEKNHETNVNNLEKRIVEVENGIKHIDDTLDGLNSIYKRNEDTNREVKEYIEKEISSQKVLINSINENENYLKERILQNENHLRHIDDSIDGLQNKMANIEGRHMETVEKMKEVTVLASNIQVQVKEQGQKMVEQSSNDLNQIRNQIQDIENQ